MECSAAEWRSLVGELVILNSFGIVRIQGVEGDRLLVGEPGATTAIPLAVVRSVQTLRDSPAARPDLVGDSWLR